MKRDDHRMTRMVSNYSGDIPMSLPFARVHPFPSCTFCITSESKGAFLEGPDNLPGVSTNGPQRSDLIRFVLWTVGVRGLVGKRGNGGRNWVKGTQ